MTQRKGIIPTFGQWVGAHLTAENHHPLWLPPGFAHGYMVLSDSADFLYKTTEYYSPEYERAIRWDDPTLAIDWPVRQPPILSQKDLKASFFKDAEVFDE